jgi:hypothetical protein
MTISRTLLAIAGSLLALAACQGTPPAATQARATEPAPPAPARAEANPYGVCAHVTRPGEHAIAAREYALMRPAGLGWVRGDFDWPNVQPEPGVWKWEMLDASVDAAEAGGIRLLPILTYQAKWAKPSGSHREEWLEFVRRAVTRYRGRLHHWEVWNEPNLSYAWDQPDGAAYGRLLGDTYQVIKQVDPGATVLFGGTASIPLPFIEAALKAGARFDAMNVHPYRPPHEVAQLPADIAALENLLARHGAGGKPLWFTELGWATQTGIPPLVAGAVRAGLAAIDAQARGWTVAVLDEPGLPTRAFNDATVAWILPAGSTSRRIAVADLAGLDPARDRCLLMPPSEGFPQAQFDAIESFVRRGGVLLLTHGVPFYNAWQRTAEGTWSMQRNVPETYRQRLRIGWEADWTKSGAPTKAAVKPVAQWAALFPPQIGQIQHATRFLTERALQPGDTFTPLVEASHEAWRGCAAALYRYGDLKGATVVVPLMETHPGVGEAEQGQLLVASYLHALHAGVERLFWYELQATEWKDYDKEDHFGLLHRDLSPKPAWGAYGTLVRLRPPGSTVLASPEPGKAVARWGWKRPDGSCAWALWRQEGEAPATLRLSGAVTEACDFLGQPVAIPADGRVTLGPAGLFLAGPATVTP